MKNLNNISKQSRQFELFDSSTNTSTNLQNSNILTIKSETVMNWRNKIYAHQSKISEGNSNKISQQTIINDKNYYDALKVLTNVLVLAGYSGLIIHIDEMVNLLRISHTPSRKQNMEQILRIYNDVMQSNQENLGVYLSGTPEFLTNERIGLYSYDALKGRLQENTFLTGDAFDPDHPVIRINPLDSNQIYQLIEVTK